MNPLAEVVIVGAVGAAAGLVANALSEDGLDLTRDHFPRVAPVVEVAVPPDPGAPSDPAGPTGATGSSGAEDAGGGAPEIDPKVAARITGQGLGVMTHAEALAVHSDPAREFGAYVFVDARHAEDFDEGHIPGAINFDHYHPGKSLNAVLPVVTDPGTLKVIVYCIGGDCEDSEFAAVALMQLGVPPDRLFVYVGGIERWESEGLPVETSEG